MPGQRGTLGTLMTRFPRGLYALTPDLADTRALAGRVREAIRGGAAAVQYRNKAAPAALRHEQAVALLEVCRPAGVPLIVNDDVELAMAIGADGAHLGGEDGDLAAARRRLGSRRLLGASCYNRLEQALAAVTAGADYVAFGAAFPSPTKPGAVRAPLALYREARRTLSVGIVAIGGITVDNAAELLAAGVDAIAVITALFEAGDVEQRARELRELFARIESP